jgi:hypothetical protein
MLMTRQAPHRKEEVSHIEIVADVGRLARAAPPEKTAKQIFADIKAFYPEIDEAQIRRACGEAADLLLKQHG